MSNRAALKSAKLPGRAYYRGRPGDAIGRAARTLGLTEGRCSATGDGDG